MSQLSEQTVLDSLKQIIDPDLRKDIVTLGFIRDLKIADGHVAFRIVLTTPVCLDRNKLTVLDLGLVVARAEHHRNVRSIDIGVHQTDLRTIGRERDREVNCNGRFPDSTFTA